jgi:hypothetical protein
LVGITLIATGACTRKEQPLGSAENPVKLFFVPSVDAKVLAEKGELVKKYLETETGLKFAISVPTSYVAVVESFGTSRADVAAINTFGYLLANEKYGAQALITFIRYGSDTYQAQIIAKADSKISSLKDLAGKKFAFVDPASTSGYLLPAKMFKDQGVELKETDRIQALQNELAKLGVKLIENHQVYQLDCSALHFPSRLIINTYDDHRMAMAFAPLALMIKEIEIEDAQVVIKSYPHFWDDLMHITN